MLGETDLNVDGSEKGLLAILTPKLDFLTEGAKTNTGAAAELGRAAGRELGKAARYYDNTDLGEAANLDAQYPPERSEPVDSQDVRDPAAAESFRDVADPQADASGEPFSPRMLANTGDEQLARDLTRDEGWPTGLEQEITEIIGFGGRLTSINDFIAEQTGFDILEECIELFAGDWQALYRQSVLFDQIGTAFDAIKANIDQGRAGIAPNWDGNAASNAENWLAQYSRSSAAHSTFMTEAADRIRDFAQSAYHYVVYIKDVLGVIVDLALEILGAFTGGTLNKVLDVIGKILEGGSIGTTAVDLAESLGDGVDARDILKLVALVAQLESTVALLVQAVSLLVGLAHGAAGLIEVIAAAQPVESQPWPAEPYDHPEV
ncbi:hypothetical protein EV191_1034 [Tamaricihabitans halophyticus]|uniref:Type VII secretion system (Wss) protein ESAT-6 n=1 Tax=Tamaricihabitans halophyticus TaxID=1262583 RepID=A0A4R2QXC1_9PSEU|nr:hypothetical protein [Tamaricihabitans halophyticus]TCP53964.1 hypothetical protein EV191_1034 [Tamaricihabitans halophyticus]